MRKTLATLVVTLAALGTIGATAGTASAGEITGSGNPTPVNSYNANSFCAFSGLDDMDFESPVQPGVVQTFGSIPKGFRPPPGSEEHPGQACNGHKTPTKGGLG